MSDLIKDYSVVGIDDNLVINESLLNIEEVQDVNTITDIATGVADAATRLLTATHDLIFSVTDADTVAWVAGNVYLKDGTSYAIAAGNTGNMVAENFIYFDLDVSKVALQLTTDKENAEGPHKILVAVAQNAANEALFKVYNSKEENMDGGNIRKGSLTVNELNFTPVDSSTVIATINASSEGIQIDADNIKISGATTFTAGYDPTGRVLAVGGTYDSAAVGARVRIFPDASTGIQVIDDAGADVFKVMVGGATVGDIIFGNYSGGQGIFYDKSLGTTTFKGSITITGGSGIASLTDAGDLATLDTIGASKLDTTVISGGKIITGLLTASNIQTGTLNASLITVQNFTVGTNVNIGTAFPAASAGDLAYLNLVSAAKLDTTVIVGGYIKTSLLTASNIQTGTLNASLVSVTNLNASNITTGSLNASVITVTNLNASNISTGVLSPDRIDTFAIRVSKLNSDATDRFFTSSSIKSSIEAWRHGSDVTLIDGGKIYTGSVNANRITANTITGSQITTGRLDTTTQSISSKLAIGAALTPTNALYVNGSVDVVANVNCVKVNLSPGSSNPSTQGDIVCYDSGGTEQFRGKPGGAWTGSFDMTAY